MPREFVLRAKPGYDIREAVANPTLENAEICEYEHGRLVAVHPATPSMLSILEPKPPPEYYREEKTAGMLIPKEIPERTYGAGVSPFVQEILRIVSTQRVSRWQDIYEALVSKRLVSRSGASRRMVKSLVKWMSGRVGYLTILKERGKTYYTLPITPKGEYAGPHVRPPLIEVKENVDPIAWEVCEFVRSMGSATHAQIVDYIVSQLGWLTDTRYLEKYLKLLVKHGYLEKVGNTYRFLKPLDRLLI
jgi:hypothetical protein